MKPLELIGVRLHGIEMDDEVDIEATLQAIIDRVNELSEMANNPLYTVPDDFKWEGKIEPGSIRKLVPPKHFKAGEVIIKPIYEGMRDTYYMVGTVHSSEAEAQAALELLLNL